MQSNFDFGDAINPNPDTINGNRDQSNNISEDFDFDNFNLAEYLNVDPEDSQTVLVQTPQLEGPATTFAASAGPAATFLQLIADENLRNHTFKMLTYLVFDRQPLLSLSAERNRNQASTKTPIIIVEEIRIIGVGGLEKLLEQLFPIFLDKIQPLVVSQASQHSLEVYLEAGIFAKASKEALDTAWLRVSHTLQLDVEHYQAGRLPVPLIHATKIPDDRVEGLLRELGNQLDDLIQDTRGYIHNRLLVTGPLRSLYDFAIVSPLDFFANIRAFIQDSEVGCLAFNTLPYSVLLFMLKHPLWLPHCRFGDELAPHVLGVPIVLLRSEFNAYAVDETGTTIMYNRPPFGGLTQAECVELLNYLVVLRSGSTSPSVLRLRELLFLLSSTLGESTSG